MVPTGRISGQEKKVKIEMIFLFCLEKPLRELCLMQGLLCLLLKLKIINISQLKAMSMTEKSMSLYIILLSFDCLPSKLA